MLRCQNLRRRHHNCLAAVFYRHICRCHGHRRFSASHISLYEPVHNIPRNHIRCYFFKHLILGVGKFKGKGRKKLRHIDFSHFDAVFICYVIIFKSQKRRLEHKQLLKYKSFSGNLIGFGAFGHMNVFYGKCFTGQPVLFPYRKRDTVRYTFVGNFKGIFNYLSENLLAQARTQRIYGYYSALPVFSLDFFRFRGIKLLCSVFLYGHLSDKGIFYPRFDIVFDIGLVIPYGINTSAFIIYSYLCYAHTAEI